MEKQERPSEPVPLFLSYAQEDVPLLQKLEVHLSLLKRQGLISPWHHRQIIPGADWTEAVDEHLEHASVILLLISPNFLASDYCYGFEMRRALELHEQGRARVIPILLRPVDLKGTVLSKLKPLPTNGKPLSKWSKRDDAFFDITQGIRQVIDELYTPSQREDSLEPSSPPFNVFCYNQQLFSPKEFYGRARERMVLKNRAEQGASTSIVGPRRIGKTWLMKYFQLTARQELGSRVLVRYLDVTTPRCATVAGFAGSALEELSSQRHAFTQGNEGLVALEQAVQDLNRQDQKIVLCLDEFEGFANHQEFDLNFFTALRALTQCGLCLMVASKEPLIAFVGDYGKTSGFFNVFKQCTLNPFTAKEAKQFVQSKGDQARFTDQERRKLLQYGQAGDDESWPPLRLQLAGELLLDDKILAMQENDPEKYRPEASDYWQNFGDRLEEIYRGAVR